MYETNIFACTICGKENIDPRKWFLITENSWEDKLRILEWNDLLASQAGLHPACSPAHVQELVVHWMATGSVAHPFARTDLCSASGSRWSNIGKTPLLTRTNHTRTIGELVVHRESMHRVLSENPASLKSILDALQVALQPKNSGESEIMFPAAV